MYITLGMLQKIKDFFHDIAYYLVELLPSSPFFALMDEIEKNETVSTVLGYVNYFLPINLMIQTLTLWLAAVGSYYLVMAGLRWAKVVA